MMQFRVAREIVCGRLDCLRDRRKHLLQCQLATVLGQAWEGLEEQRSNWVDHVEAPPPAEPLRNSLSVCGTTRSTTRHQVYYPSMDAISVRVAFWVASAAIGWQSGSAGVRHSLRS